MGKEILTRQVEGLEVRALFKPTTLNEDNRTIDVVFATETPVRTYTWEDGDVNEVLSFEAGAVRMDRLMNGAPVLNNHDRYEGTESVLGVVETASISNGEGIATLRFSKREDVTGTWQDIKDGILRGISVGYRVFKYEITKEDGKLPIYRAVDWEPYEISIAPVQADPNSKVRSQEQIKEEKQKPTKTNTMTKEEKEAADLVIAENARKEKELRDAAIVGERNRVNDITDVVRKANLKSDFAEKLIKDGISIEAARALVIDEIAKENETKISSANTVKVGVEEKEKVRKGMEDAIEHRANPTIALTDIGREFRSLTMVELARKCAEDAGISTKGLSQREIAQTALGLSTRAYMSSSDFPNVLSNVVNKTLRRQYELQNPTFQAFSQRGTFRDFKSKSIVQLGDVTKMKEIAEGGEYKHGSMGETAESYAAKKYGIIIPLTWESIVNDDLSAFSRIPTSIANKARQLQSDIVYSLLSSNSNMGDGIALFDAAGHGNYTSSGTVINVANLQIARTAIRNQKDAQGDALNLVPKYLVVGPAQEQVAYQYTSSQYTPTKNSDINPIYNAALTVIVDARITGNEWYLIADPAMIDTIEYSFLEGEGELFTEQRIGWDVDGMEMKARMVFNAKAIDYRGMYKNAGA